MVDRNRKHAFYRGKIYVPFFWFTLGIIFLLNLGGWLFYLSANAYLEKELGERLTTLARVIARLKEEGNSSYLSIIQELIKKGEIRGACIWQGEEKKVIGEVDTDIWNVVDGTEIKRAWEGKTAYTLLYPVEGKLFKRGYAPLYAEGKVAGVVGVEGEVFMLRSLYGVRRALLLSGLGSTILILSLFLLSWKFLSKYLSLLEELEFQERVSHLGDMASSLLHEIGNPLGIMQTTLEALKEEEDSQERKKLIGYLEDEIDRLSQKTRNFLLGKEKEETIDMCGFMKSFLLPWKENLEKEGISLLVKIKDKNLPWKGRKEDLREILQNLIQNARESIEKGGEIEVGLEKKKKYYLLWIKDTGKGMSKEIKKRIFTPFFTTKGKGRGWGLVKVKRILEEYGGKIKFDSRPGKGTEFLLFFPVE
ncbi:HAMP domain-containing histidine kinase [Candidatus Calescamantes bacterium]|nr:HAMP domain-containing histidine kinase [Candidatus Calescamantes bacterium]